MTDVAEPMDIEPATAEVSSSELTENDFKVFALLNSIQLTTTPVDNPNSSETVPPVDNNNYEEILLTLFEIRKLSIENDEDNILLTFKYLEELLHSLILLIVYAYLRGNRGSKAAVNASDIAYSMSTEIESQDKNQLIYEIEVEALIILRNLSTNEQIQYILITKEESFVDLLIQLIREHINSAKAAGNIFETPEILIETLGILINLSSEEAIVPILLIDAYELLYSLQILLLQILFPAVYQKDILVTDLEEPGNNNQPSRRGSMKTAESLENYQHLIILRIVSIIANIAMVDENYKYLIKIYPNHSYHIISLLEHIAKEYFISRQVEKKEKIASARNSPRAGASATTDSTANEGKQLMSTLTTEVCRQALCALRNISTNKQYLVQLLVSSFSFFEIIVNIVKEDSNLDCKIFALGIVYNLALQLPPSHNLLRSPTFDLPNALTRFVASQSAVQASEGEAESLAAATSNLAVSLANSILQNINENAADL
jgi:hypothetical protein